MFCCCPKKSLADPSTRASGRVTRSGVEMETMHVRKDQLVDSIAQTWRDDIRAISTRDHLSLPIHTDIPRMARKMVVEHRSHVVSGEDYPEALGAMIAVVCELTAAIYGDENVSRCREALSDVKEGSDYGQGFLRYLQNPANFPDHRLLNTLKLLHQKIIFPAYYYVKHCLGPTVEIRDVKGTWKVYVAFREWPEADPTESEQLSHEQPRVSIHHPDGPAGVVVTHTRSQRSAKFATDAGDPDFEFDWELKLVTDETFDSLVSVEVVIREPRFHPNMDKKEQQEIIKSLRANNCLPGARKLSRKLSGFVAKALKA